MFDLHMYNVVYLVIGRGFYKLQELVSNPFVYLYNKIWSIEFCLLPIKLIYTEIKVRLTVRIDFHATISIRDNDIVYIFTKSNLMILVIRNIDRYNI